jgi:hypothetical protein
MMLTAVLICVSIPAASSPLEDLFPSGKEAAGWWLSEKPRFFGPDTLWDYINGQAEVYLQYGFRRVGTADYKAEKSGDALVVEIYRMASPHHAFGIYAAERSPDEKPVDIGVQGYAGANVLNFWKGPYYVKLMSFKTSPAVQEGLFLFSRIIDGKIPGKYAEPALFACFPAAHRVKMSERFIPVNFLGHAFLNNGYRVDYEREGKRYQAFLVENSDPEQAAAAFGQYADFLASTGVRIAREKDQACQKIITEGGKRKAVFLFGRFIGGVLDMEEPAAADDFIEKMLTCLKKESP